MTNTSVTESRGVALAHSIFPKLFGDGVSVLDTQSAREAEVAQRTFGDYLFVRPNSGEIIGIEVKAEERWTGNLFVEVWSNATPFRHERKGWISTSSATGLLSFYLDRRACAVINFQLLKQWFERNDRKYRMVEVHRSIQGEQRNRTMGCPVPFADLPRQLVSYWRLSGNGIWVLCRLSDIANTAPN